MPAEPSELIRHMAYHEESPHERPHKWPDCYEMSEKPSNLIRHLDYDGEKPYQCLRCMYASPSTMKLKRHMMITHMGSRFKCELCHTRFAQKNTLAIHQKVHPGDVVIVPAEDLVEVGNESKGGDGIEIYEDNDVQSNPVEDQEEAKNESKGDVKDDELMKLKLMMIDRMIQKKLMIRKVMKHLPMMPHFDGECKDDWT